MPIVDMTTTDADEGRYADGEGILGDRQRSNGGVSITQDR